MTTSVQHVSSSGRKQLKHLVRHTHCILLSRPEFFNLIWEPNFETHLAPDLNSWKDCFLMPAVSLKPARLLTCSSQLTTLFFFPSPEIQLSTSQNRYIFHLNLCKQIISVLCSISTCCLRAIAHREPCLILGIEVKHVPKNSMFWGSRVNSFECLIKVSIDPGTNPVFWWQVLLISKFLSISTDKLHEERGRLQGTSDLLRAACSKCQRERRSLTSSNALVIFQSFLCGVHGMHLVSVCRHAANQNMYALECDLANYSQLPNSIGSALYISVLTTCHWHWNSWQKNKDAWSLVTSGSKHNVPFKLSSRLILLQLPMQESSKQWTSSMSRSLRTVVRTWLVAVSSLQLPAARLWHSIIVFPCSSTNAFCFSMTCSHFLLGRPQEYDRAILAIDTALYQFWMKLDEIGTPDNPNACSRFSPDAKHESKATSWQSVPKQLCSPQGSLVAVKGSLWRLENAPPKFWNNLWCKVWSNLWYSHDRFWSRFHRLTDRVFNCSICVLLVAFEKW